MTSKDRRSHILLIMVYLQLVLVFAAVSFVGQNAFAQTTITLDGRNCAETFKGLWLDFSLWCILDDPVKIPANTTLLVREGSNLENKAILENHGKLEIQGYLTNHGTFLNYGSVNIDRIGVIPNHGVIENEGDINNSGQLNNYGEILNIAEIKNDERFSNYGSLTNNGTIDSDFFLNNEGTIINGKSGIINSKDSKARITHFYNYGTTINDGMITITDRSVLENWHDQYKIKSVGVISNSGTIKIDALSGMSNRGAISNSGTISYTPSDTADRFVNSERGTISNSGTISSTNSFVNGGVINNTGSIRQAILLNDGLINNSCDGSVSGTVEGNEPVETLEPCTPTSQSTTIELNKDSCSLDPFNGQFDSSTGTCTVAGFIVGSDVSLTIAPGVELYNNANAVNAGAINLLGGITTAGHFDNSGVIIINGDGTLKTSSVEDGAAPSGGTISSFGTIEIIEGTLQIAEHGNLTNIGTIVNHDRLINSNSFENLGSGTIWSEGTFANTGTIANSGKIKNCGPAISGSVEGTASIEQNCMPDGSGSVNYAISSGEQEFNVATALTNGIVIDVVPDPASNRLILTMATSPSTQGELTITLPRSVIDAKDDNGYQQFILLIDNEEVDYEETGVTDTERVLKVVMPAGASKIDVIGTQVVPEFPISLLMLAAAIGSIVVVMRRFALQK